MAHVTLDPRQTVNLFLNQTPGQEVKLELPLEKLLQILQEGQAPVQTSTWTENARTAVKIAVGAALAYAVWHYGLPALARAVEMFVNQPTASAVPLMLTDGDVQEQTTGFFGGMYTTWLVEPRSWHRTLDMGIGTTALATVGKYVVAPTLGFFKFIGHRRMP